jgi:membrane-associated phospholipid phosphatase
VLGYPAPMPLIDLVTTADRTLAAGAAELRAAPLTAVMTLASAWWVKSLLIAGIGAAADLRRRPGRIPRTPVLAGVALLVASLASGAVKDLIGRLRPPLADETLSALVALPADASFPSGHATSAFAAAGVVAALHPRLRAPILGLAALVALSRVYLGVHFPSDVLAGAALGLGIAVAVVALGRRLVPAAWPPTPFTPTRIGARMRAWRSSPST